MGEKIMIIFIDIRVQSSSLFLLSPKYVNMFIYT